MPSSARPTASTSSSRLTAEERAARLAAMSAAAEEHEKSQRERHLQALAQAEAEAQAQRARKATPGSDEPVAFLQKIHSSVYTGSNETLADRLNKNRHFRQKGDVEMQKFL